MPLRHPARSLMQAFMTVLVIGSMQDARGQEQPGKNPFADPDMKPDYQARCH
jgi:hypothetical protein